MEIKIRRGDTSDIPFLTGLERECFSSPWSEVSFADFFENSASRCLIAEVDSVPCGYVGCYLILGDGEITNLAVTEKFRRHGVGAALIGHLSCLEGTNRLLLEVRESNAAARGLYEKLGFKVDGVRRGFYEKPREDAILMSLQIDSKEN